MIRRLGIHRLTGVLLLGSLFALQAFAREGNAGPSSETKEPEQWSFRPVRRPEVPRVRAGSWVRTPVDAFVLARLEKEGLKPAPVADRRTLLRRVYLDLIGLPPSPEEQQAFLADPSPGAYARVVDDLLSRPQYGERWARHWLDVVRYAETNGYERDGAKPSAWRYRDYVIDSLNKDKPYDRFVTEQLAGDEIPGSTAETQIATTFLRLGTWDDEPADPVVDRYDQLDDVLGTTATTFLGLTLRCARCHDHKFEPFTQVDYYRMLAVFEPLKRPQIGRKEFDWPVGGEAERAADQAALLSAVSGQGSVASGSMSPVSGALSLVGVQAARVRKLPRAYIWYEDGPKAGGTRVFRRGDPKRPAQEVEPGLPAVMVKQPSEPPRPTNHSTGRRLWLAKWLTRPDNPLVARVFVNRVWQHHFGKGLVPTANDFGVMGAAPTHPELLDWLVAEFIANGWRLKPLHRLMVLSNTYQMSATSVAAGSDADGSLLSRWPQRRLEAEAVRDSILAVCGQLNRRQAGPSMYPTLPRAVLEGQSRPGEGWGKSDERETARRSIYVFVKRVLAVPELDLLDAPDSTSSCEQRAVSTTAPQALTLLNGDFTQQQAGHFAARLEREVGDDWRAQVERAFTVALCRPPRADEVQAALDFLSTQQHQIEADGRSRLPSGTASQGPARQAGPTARRKALEAFCLVLLNTNEFVYMN